MSAEDVYKIGCEQFLQGNAAWVGPDMWAWATNCLSAAQRKSIRKTVVKEYAEDCKENGDNYDNALKWAQQDLKNIR